MHNVNFKFLEFNFLEFTYEFLESKIFSQSFIEIVKCCCSSTMIIKELKATNFMSLKDITLTDLHHGYNVFVGVNGSGKTTFLKAITFVFTNLFPCKTTIEKLAVLNDSTKFARVDIIVDNEYRRFPIEKTTLCFSRQIDMKSDRYFINNKRISKTDFFKILEYANMLIEHPIYITTQGNANRLALISNESRLEILKEVSGYRKFMEIEDFIKNKCEVEESTDIDFLSKALDIFRKKYDFVKEQVANLEEATALKKTIDTIRRIISNRKLEEIEKDLETAEAKETLIEDQISHLEADFQKEVEEESELANSLRNLENLLEITEKTKSKLLLQQKGSTAAENIFKLQCVKLQKELESLEKKTEATETEIEKENENIKALEDELFTIIPKYNKEVEELEKLKEEFALKEQEVEEIYAKKSRARQFQSMSDKDKWIENDISNLRNEIKKHESVVLETDEEILILEGEKSEIEKDIKTLGGQLQSQKSAMESDNRSIENLFAEKTQISRKLTNLRDQKIEKERQLSKIDSKLTKVDGELQKLVSVNTLKGVKSIRRVLEVFKEREEITTGYFGLLIDLFKVREESSKIAVDNLAGNNLFKFVVASEKLTLKFMEEFFKLDFPGEVGFLPLERLRCSELQMSPENTLHVLKVLEYDHEYDSAMRYVFGRKLICKDFDICQKVAKCLKVDCITLEGDLVTRNGIFSGGFQSFSHLRLNLYEEKKKLENEVAEINLKEVLEKIKAEDEAMNGIEIKISKIRTKLELAEYKCTEIKMDLEHKEKELISLSEELAQLRKAKDVQESALKVLKSKISFLENDLNQELSSQCSKEENKYFHEIMKEVKDFSKEIAGKEERVASLKIDKENREFLKHDLRIKAETLRKIKDDMSLLKKELERNIGILESKIIDLKGSTFETVPNLDSDLDNEIKQKEIIEQKLEEIDQKKETLKKKLKINSNIKAKINLNTRRLRAKKSQYEEEIQSAGFSESVAKKFQNFSRKDLLNNIKKMQKKLRRIDVDPRQKELQTLIENFVGPIELGLENNRLKENFKKFMTLATEKAAKVLDDAFTELSRHFDESFKKFVPEGRGVLMKCSDDAESIDEAYTGIDVSVSFSGRQLVHLNTLSGGQKSVVSLALILAISQISSPPFYIFDEVDAALSGSNVEALANIINEVKNRSQIFTATFNRQVLEKGDKFYKVTTKNNRPSIQSVDRAEASAII